MRLPLFRATLVAAALISPAVAGAQADPGAYLAARQAAMDNDFATGARYYTESLLSDPSNPLLLESTVTSFMSLGQIERAIPVARQMEALGIASQVAHLALLADEAQRGDWDTLISALDAERTVSPLVDGIARGWALIGQDDPAGAQAAFDTVIAANGMAAYGRYHKALASAYLGEFAAAAALMEDMAAAPLNGRAAFAFAQVLSQLGRNDDAIAMLDAVFGDTVNPEVTQLRDSLASDAALPFDIVTSPAEGLGEVAYMIASLLETETRQTFTLQYARVAEFLSPDNVTAKMLTAGLLQELGQYDLADTAFSRVPPAHPSFPSAELGRIDALRMLDRQDAAIEVAEALARSHPELPFVHAKLGDVLRQNERYEEAYAAYTTALDIYADDAPNRWLVHYTRGITAYAMDVWPDAESNFRAALALNPDQPQVLNYLGYSLVERGEKLDEALGMIETAVAARPDNGAIVDSLGWVLFRLGRYEEAVVHMERAASLEAVDPIVNDHLGDVYWAVGRKIEAAFQWNRALSFDPEEELADRIRAKLDRGLDAVLEEEGEPPLRVANDDP